MIELGNALRSIGVEIPVDVYEALARLSKFYIPEISRCMGRGAPVDYYIDSEAREALQLAEMVVTWVRGVWKRLVRKV